MPISNVFGEYAQNDAEIKALKAQIAAFELKQDQLRPFIIKSMVEQGAAKLELDIGKFTVSRRKAWAYPETVLELGEAFKAAKATAESTGAATYEETESLVYTPVKL